MATSRAWVRRVLAVVAMALSLVAAGAYLRSRQHASVASSVPTATRCSGSKLTFVAQYALHGEWKIGLLRLSDRTAPTAPAQVVEPSTLSMRTDDAPERWASLAHFAPPNTRPVDVEAGRWLIVQNMGDEAIRVIDTTTSREIPGVFPKVKGRKTFSGGRALRWSLSETSVIDLASERVLHLCPDCSANDCAFGDESTNGRAIHCIHAGPHLTVTEVIDVDDASHARARICTAWERTSLDDTYVVALPSSHAFAPWCATNPFVSWRPTFGGASKQVSAQVDPRTSRFDVAFCGGGELFFTYSKAGSGPNTISMFRGTDASLVSTTSGPQGSSLASATIRAEMDESGRYLAFFADRPNDQAETWLYRLDP